MMAAARADYDAKVAELKADLEATRGEKEKRDTDLAYLKVCFVPVCQHSRCPSSSPVEGRQVVRHTSPSLLLLLLLVLLQCCRMLVGVA